ncbi:MAG: tyrosine-type recombinase/integrase [Anaerolineae bacterium]
MNEQPNAIQPAQNAELVEHQALFDRLVDGMAYMVAPSTLRVYRHTFSQWRSWCSQQDLDPLALWPANVGAFLTSTPTSKGTRQHQLSALRKLAQALYLATGDPVAERMTEALRLVKPPANNASENPRPKRALTPAMADRILRVWDGDQPMQRRNAALLSLLALTGLRRSEAAALRWSDIDLENRVVSVRHGKGDKAREVAIVGDHAIEALLAWLEHQDEGRAFVFCSVGKGGQLGADQPITGTDVYRVVKATEAKSGVAFRPHDLRRTFITEALTTGTPLADVQAQAGHAQASTTLLYAQPVNAKERLSRMRLRYG